MCNQAMLAEAAEILDIPRGPTCQRLLVQRQTSLRRPESPDPNPMGHGHGHGRWPSCTEVTESSTNTAHQQDILKDMG